MGSVWVPDNPPTREYTCPGCNKRVLCKRIGESCSYVVEHPEEKVKKGDEGEGKCKYKGPIEPKLLGYRPPKENKNEVQSGG